MRHQQVNLLAPMLRKPHALLTARLARGLCALAAAVLGAVYLVSAWRSTLLAGEQQELEARRDAITLELQTLASAQRHSQADLAPEQARLGAERDAKAALLAALARHELGNTGGFSAQFTGLSRQRLDGLWLTRATLSAGGRDIALQGATLSQALVPRYLEVLGREPVFAGTQFRHALVEGAASGQMRFELRTQTALP